LSPQPVPPPDRGHNRRMPRLLWLLSLVNLVIGTGAFVVGGILAPIAADLGTSVPAAGQAMTAYALATALLAPPFLLATGAWPRRRAILVALLMFLAGNAVCALATTLPMLLAGRVLMGLGAAFTPIAAGIAVAIALPAQRGKALALTFLGMSLSYVVGVPLGSWLGLAFHWHTPIWLVCGAAVLAMAAVARWVPADVRAPGATFVGLGAWLRQRAVASTLLVTLAYFVAIFTVFSYIGPVLQALVPMSRGQQALTLALFGLSGVVGTVLGGFANDRFGPQRTLRVQLVMLGAMMALLPLTAGHWPALMVVLFAWGMAGFGMMAPQQSRLAGLAPAAAPMLLSLNTSMLYLGTAGGAITGGGAIAAGLGFAQLAWAGVPFVALALVLLWLGHTSSPAPSRAQENTA
jgi:MFS transporter, DHA1 family, inner membrane transport protein